jgi:hypothetical protein
MKSSRSLVQTFCAVVVLFFVGIGSAQTEWTLVVSKEHLKEEAIKVSIDDLKLAGEQYGLVFNVAQRVKKSQKNVILVGKNSASKNVARSLDKNSTVSNFEGYEIATALVDGRKLITVLGGSVIGDAYGLYWILDRMRVYQDIPDINVKREPSSPIRYTRIRVKTKEDIRRSLRYGLNLVYGENPLSLIDWDIEPEKTDNAKNREKVRELIDYAHSLHMKFLTFGTDFTYHPELLEQYKASLSPVDPFFWDAVQAKYRKLFTVLPELDGIATFTGEEQAYWGNYKTFDPMHHGQDCDWSVEKRYRTFVKKVQNVVVGEFGKIYHHRTWMTTAFEQQARPEVYQDIFTDEVSTDGLYLIPSFTQHDRWWHQRYNPTFNLTPHNMLAVLEPMNYYEAGSSNIFPTFPGQYYQAGLQAILETPNSNLKGMSFDLRLPEDFRTFSLTAYTGFRLGWNYLENPKEIARDFCAIHFGQKAAEKMAEIYLLSPVAYKYGLFIEPVSYGTFNSLIHMRVGTFPAQGYPSIDNGKEHLKFLRKLYYRCKPWIAETLMYLDHGLETIEKMNADFEKAKELVENEDLAEDVGNSLKMSEMLIRTNNLYVKTFFAYFQYLEAPVEKNRKELLDLFNQYKQTRNRFTKVPGFGYRLFGVDQLLKNVEQVLDDLPKAEQKLAQIPDRDEIERIISQQQILYKDILDQHSDKAVKLLHWEGRIDGRDIISLKGEKVEIEHLRWDPPYFKDFQINEPLPRKNVTVIPRDIDSRPMHPFILEQPTEDNDYTVKVYLYDVPPGAGWCKFDLYYISESPEELGLQIPWNK